MLYIDEKFIQKQSIYLLSHNVEQVNSWLLC
jgi:hypothetical protein